MPIAVLCPSCDARLNLADTAAGKTAKCPRCGSPFAVPAAPAAPVAARPVAPARTAARPARQDDDDEDDRPRRKPPSRAGKDDEDDDFDDRPRKRRGKPAAKKGGVPVLLLAGVGGGVLLLLVGGGVAAFLLLGGKGGGGGGGGLGGVLGKSAPPGYTDVDDAEGGFRVFLPGNVVKAQVNLGPAGAQGAVMTKWVGGQPGRTTYATSFKPANGFRPGSSPDDLYASLVQLEGTVKAPWTLVESKTPVTLGGKPGLEVRAKYKPNWMDDGRDADFPPPADLPADVPPEIRKAFEENRRLAKETQDRIRRDRQQQDAGRTERHLYLVTTDNVRVVVVHIETQNDYPGEDVLKTVRESFAFK